MTDANHPNADQADFWNGPGGETWTTQRDRFNAMLGSIGDEAIARARPNRVSTCWMSAAGPDTRPATSRAVWRPAAQSWVWISPR